MIFNKIVLQIFDDDLLLESISINNSLDCYYGDGKGFLQTGYSWYGRYNCNHNEPHRYISIFGADENGMVRRSSQIYRNTNGSRSIMKGYE